MSLPALLPTNGWLSQNKTPSRSSGFCGGSYADTTIASIHLLVAHSRTISKRRSYDSNRYFALVNPPFVLICPASDDSDIQLRKCSITGITDVTCKVGSGRAAYMCLV